MIEKSSDWSCDEEKQKEFGIILGYWDQEQTFTLIQDLELTVHAIETKCQNLLQQLIYFKKYFEDLETHEYQKCFIELQKLETRKFKRKNILSGSIPDISLRKGEIEIQKVEKIFQENFEEKLLSINQSLSDAVQKIGLRQKIFLFPTDEYIETLHISALNQMPESLPNFQELLLKLKAAKARSDTAVLDASPVGLTFSKITADELKIYKKLSKLGAKKRNKRRKNISDLKKSKLAAESEKDKEKSRPKETDIKKKKKLKTKKRKKFCRKKLIESNSTQQIENIDIKMLCESLAKIVKDTSHYKTFNSSKPLDFDSQKLSLKRPHSVTSVFLKQSQSMQNRPYSVTDAARPGTQLKKYQDGESNCKKSRSKYTRSFSNCLLGYQKITSKRYSNAQKCYDESRTREAYAVGSNIMVSDCQRTNYIEMNEGSFLESGDSSQNEYRKQFREKWALVHTAFLESYRKYMTLKEQFKKNGLIPSEAELENVEKEINEAIREYKNFCKLFCKVG